MKKYTWYIKGLFSQKKHEIIHEDSNLWYRIDDVNKKVLFYPELKSIEKTTINGNLYIEARVKTMYIGSEKSEIQRIQIPIDADIDEILTEAKEAIKEYVFEYGKCGKITNEDEWNSLSVYIQKVCKWESSVYASLVKKYNVPSNIENPTVILKSIETIPCYIWVVNNCINLFPTEDTWAFSSNLHLKHDEIDYSLTIIPIDDIEYYLLDGEVHYETEITGSGGDGGGSSLGGAVLGSLIAGPTGAIIGSRAKINPIEISSTSIKHDDRNCMLYFKKGNIVNCLSFYGYDFYTFQQLIPQKEYSVVQELKKSELINQSQVKNDTSIPNLIKELASLKENGILTEEEFALKKKELLGRM